MSVRVEFFGVPASGKSTLCRAALAHLASSQQQVIGLETAIERGLRARDFGKTANLVGRLVPDWRRNFLGMPHSMDDWIRFAALYPAYASLVHQWLFEAPRDQEWRGVDLYAILETVFRDAVMRELGIPTLIEEGFAQRFFSLRGYHEAVSDHDARNYARVMPRPRGLILVSTSDEICRERLQNRPRPLRLLADNNSSPTLAFLQRGKRMLEDLADEVEALGIPVLRVQGSGDIASHVETMATFIRPLLTEDKLTC
jgi:hypothetical protein